jgi:hypothetical protein
MFRKYVFREYDVREYDDAGSKGVGGIAGEVMPPRFLGCLVLLFVFFLVVFFLVVLDFGGFEHGQ